MKVIHIRCSALPAAFTCPGSAQAVDVEIAPSSEPADQGSAGHEVMQAIVDTDARSIDDIDIVEIARRFEADPEELRIQAFTGLKVWKQIRSRFGGAQGEVELTATIKIDDDTEILLTGHLDVLALAHALRRADHADWKFARVDRHYGHQVKGYGYLILANYPEIDVAHGAVVWLAGEPGIENYSLDREQAAAWAEKLVERVAQWDGVYHPGPVQCRWCRVNHACPAILEMTRRDVLIIGGPDMRARIETGLANLPDAEVVDLHRRWKTVEKIGKDLTEAIKLRVHQAGGALADGAGRELRFTEQRRRVIDTGKGIPVLERYLDNLELEGCVTIRPSAVDKAVSDKTPRGKKAEQIEAVDNALRAADAIREDVIEKLVDQRTKE
jgi:hypothetical protein